MEYFGLKQEDKKKEAKNMILTLELKENYILYNQLVFADICNESSNVVCMQLSKSDVRTLQQMFHSLDVSDTDIYCIYDDSIYYLIGYDLDFRDDMYYFYLSLTYVEPYLNDTLHTKGNIYSSDGRWKIYVKYYPSELSYSGYYILDGIDDYSDWYYVENHYENDFGSERCRYNLDRLLI